MKHAQTDKELHNLTLPNVETQCLSLTDLFRVLHIVTVACLKMFVSWNVEP
jgi:hypothetical protein